MDQCATSDIRPPQGYEDLDPHSYPCSLSLLGPIQIFVAGKIVEGGWRRKSLELLAYLSIRPRGASRDQILEALWPGGDPKLTQRYLWQSVSQVHQRLGRGEDHSRIIQKVDDSYRLDLAKLWVDIVAFEAAVNRSSRAEDAEDFLSFACSLYKGEFCEGRYFSWATRDIERLRSACIDAVRQLATLLEVREKKEQALLLLDMAIALDPYDEDLYRRAILLEAELGRRDRLVRRFRKLRRLMIEDLGLEPSPATLDALMSAGADNLLPNEGRK